MATSAQLQVYETGPLTVVGFGGRVILDQIDVGTCRAELVALISANQTKELAFDLTGVKLIPSGMLGLIASVRNLGVEVSLYNPSEDIQEVLEITRLNTCLKIHFLDIQPPNSNGKA